ncbi:MAG: glutathione S-transferase family protein, partial [Cyanobacteria bacterium J06639_18]
MLKFYYNPLSPMSRRVWRGLLEKEIPFEPILIELNGDHLQADYLAINPFHHVPVIIDDGLRILESIA